MAWSVNLEKIKEKNYDLDQKNPNDPDATVDSIGETSASLGDIQETISNALENLITRTATLIDKDDPKQYSLDQISSQWNLVNIRDSGIQLNIESRNPATASPDIEFKYIDLATVSHGIINEPKSILGLNAPSRARRVVRQGNVIFSTVRSYLNGHAVIPQSLDNQICSTGFSVFVCPENIIPEFLLFMLMSPYVIQQCRNMMRGGHYPALKDENVKRILIPIPDRNKQFEIVNLVKTAKSDIDSQIRILHNTISKTDNTLNNIFPSLLAKVFRGDFEN